MRPRIPISKWPIPHQTRHHGKIIEQTRRNNKGGIHASPKRNPQAKPSFLSKPSPPPIPFTRNLNLSYQIPSTSRLLGYSLLGAPLSHKNIPTIVICHGFPGSRLDADGLIPESLLGKVRVIGIDRPGMGTSTHQPRRRLLDWPIDVLHLMDGMGIEKFSVLGGSAGGPYALACARVIEQSRLNSVAVVCGYAPIGGTGSGISGGLDARERFLLQRPNLMALVMWWRVGRFVHGGNQKVWRDMAREMGVVGEDEVENCIQSLKEPFRNGVRGYVRDGVIMSDPDWGFDVSDVKGKVSLWYGTEDTNTPPEMGRWLEERLEGGVLKIVDGASHFSLLSDHREMVMRDLLKGS